MKNKDNPIVNYIWMQFERGKTKPVPSHLFRKVQRNARRYPDTEFRVWVDDLGALAPYRIPKNVEIRALSSVNGFTDVPLMASKEKKHGWAKVDVARLLIIRHILQNEFRPAIYADMDVPNVKVDSKKLHSRLEEFGAAFGATFKRRKGKKRILDDFENGYMAFMPRELVLVDRLIETSQKANYNARSGVFQKQSGALDDWAENKGIANWREKVAGFPVLRPTGWQGKTWKKAELN